jgi:outer membrane lipoprotein SlyB
LDNPDSLDTPGQLISTGTARFRHNHAAMRPLLVLAGLVTLAGCAAQHPKAALAVPPDGDVSYGTILVERQADIGQGVLAAIGETAGRADPATEFIIREDDGETVSVVQASGARLKPGERVMIIHGSETRLAAATAR